MVFEVEVLIDEKEKRGAKIKNGLAKNLKMSIPIFKSKILIKQVSLGEILV